MIAEYNEKLLHRFLWDKSIVIGAYPMMINGMPDHVHILIKIKPVHNVSAIVKNLKGSSSRFMNDLSGNKNQFEWSRGFGAFTVSEKDIDMISNYIRNQKEHHRSGKPSPDLEVEL